MSYGKGQETIAAPLKPPDDDGAFFNKIEPPTGAEGFGTPQVKLVAEGVAEQPQYDEPATEDILKLQNAIGMLATALIELDVTHNAEGSTIVREGLNSALSTSAVLRSVFFKGLLDATEQTFIDEHIKKVIERGRTSFTDRSNFRKEVIKLVRQYRDKIHYRFRYYPYDDDGILDRSAELGLLERADISIPYPNPSTSSHKFIDAYPDEQFIEVVDKILKTSKRYYTYLMFDAAFNSFLDELHELNEKRKAKKLEAHTDTPFSSIESLKDLVKIFAVAYNKLTIDFDRLLKSTMHSTENSFLLTEAVVSQLKEKLAISHALLTPENQAEYLAQLKEKGLVSPDAKDLPSIIGEGEVSIPSVITDKDNTRIKAMLGTIWENLKKNNLVAYQQAMGSHQLLPFVQKEKEQLERDKSKLTRELAAAQSTCHAMSAEIADLKAKNRDLADAHSKAEEAHQGELEDLHQLLNRQIESQRQLLESLQLTLVKNANAFQASNESKDQYEAQIRELEQEIEKLKHALSKAQKTSKKRLVFSDSESDAPVVTDESSTEAHVGAACRFGFGRDEEKSKQVSNSTGFSSDEDSRELPDPKFKGGFTPPDKTGSALNCE